MYRGKSFWSHILALLLSLGCEPKLRKLMNRAREKLEAGTQPNSWQRPAATSHHRNYFEDSGCCFWSIFLLATACNYGEVHRNTYMPLVHAHTVRLEICNCIFPCGLLDSHASHNYLFVRLQQLWYTQEKVAMTCCRQVKPIGAVDFDTQPTLWVSARLFWPIFRSRKRSQKLGPKMGPWS